MSSEKGRSCTGNVEQFGRSDDDRDVWRDCTTEDGGNPKVPNYYNYNMKVRRIHKVRRTVTGKSKQVSGTGCNAKSARKSITRLSTRVEWRQ